MECDDKLDERANRMVSDAEQNCSPELGSQVRNLCIEMINIAEKMKSDTEPDMISTLERIQRDYEERIGKGETGCREFQAQLMYNLGCGYAEVGRPNAAIGCFNNAINVMPAHHRAHYNLGTLLASHNKYGSAQYHLIRAIEFAAARGPVPNDYRRNLRFVEERLYRPPARGGGLGTPIC
jgi:tetratricopeptide (TPR) repeat protein